MALDVRRLAVGNLAAKLSATTWSETVITRFM
jgi:hypothetical protein